MPPEGLGAAGFTAEVGALVVVAVAVGAFIVGGVGCEALLLLILVSAATNGLSCILYIRLVIPTPITRKVSLCNKGQTPTLIVALLQKDTQIRHNTHNCIQFIKHTFVIGLPPSNPTALFVGVIRASAYRRSLSFATSALDRRLISRLLYCTEQLLSSSISFFPPPHHSHLPLAPIYLSSFDSNKQHNGSSKRHNWKYCISIVYNFWNYLYS